jgi:polar amino acid transport system substrate-binding protein
VKAGNPFDLHSYEDVAKNADVLVGVMAGAFEEDYLKAVGVPEDRIVIFPDGPAGIAGLQADRVHAFTLTSLSIQSLLENANDSNLERATPFTDPIIDGQSIRGCGAVAFRKEDADLRDAYNAELEKMKASGELLALIEPYGFTEAELPGDVTAEDLCKPTD